VTKKTALRALFKVIEDEADLNPAFAERLFGALGDLAATIARDAAVKPAPKPRRARTPATPKAGRAPAALDPVRHARQGEATLREGLAALSVQQLKDIIAEFGMDAGGQTTRWSRMERLVDHIVLVAMARATKGDAFL
jgi:hypothetical protein